MPHFAVLVPARQVLPSQQPAQVVPSQTHVPPWQRLLAGHCAPLPQRQVPFAQLSARGPHGLQLLPFVPHWVSWFTWQTPPWQQPFGQLV